MFLERVPFFEGQFKTVADTGHVVVTARLQADDERSLVPKTFAKSIDFFRCNLRSGAAGHSKKNRSRTRQAITRLESKV